MKTFLKKLFFNHKIVLRIKIIPIEKSLIFEVHKPSLLRDRLLEIYFLLLQTLTDKFNTIAVSQFFDEDQGLVLSSDCDADVLSKKYKLLFNKTRNFDTDNQPTSKDRNYVIHFCGSPNLEWVRCVLIFGGTSLSNIIYGINDNCAGWFDKIITWNGLFVNYYWLKTESPSVEELLRDVGIICWTSDSRLTFMVRNSERNRIIQGISNLATKQNLTLEFIE